MITGLILHDQKKGPSLEGYMMMVSNQVGGMLGPSVEGYAMMVSLETANQTGPTLEGYNIMVSNQMRDTYGIGESLVMHLDATQITNLNDLDGVASWENIATTNTSLYPVQATAGNRPKYRTASFNGLPCVSFNGVNEFLAVPFWTSSYMAGDPDVTAIVVYRKNTVAKGSIFGFGTGAPPNAFGFYDDNTIPQWAFSGNPLNVNACAASDTFIRSYVKKRGVINVTSTSRLDGVDDRTNVGDSTNTPAISVSTELHIGKWFSAYGHIDIAELILCKSALADSAVETIRAALATKWGV